MARNPTEANPGPGPNSETPADDQPPQPASDPLVREAILQHCAAAGPGRSVDPSSIAQALGGSPAEVVPWRALIRRIRAEAAALQDENRIQALRKGRPVDIRAAKGVIRLGLAGRPED